MPLVAGECICKAAESLGGAFLKAAQILGTRVDLLPASIIAALSRLKDNAKPIKYAEIEPFLRSLADLEVEDRLEAIDQTPFASATIAQVHKASEFISGRFLAIKVRRPGIAQLLQADVGYIRLLAWGIAWLPWFRRLPIRDATNEVCKALVHQADFEAEAIMTRRFQRLFSNNADVRIPVTIDRICNKEVIVMDYLAGYAPIQNIRADEAAAKKAVLTGLRALYSMIFCAGLIHCDLHSGNILAKADGRIALLDFGFVAEMSPEAKRDFAEFFLSIALCDGKTAASIVRATAASVAADFEYDAFERDMESLITDTAGRRAGDFQVAAFVVRLFHIQAKHGIYGSPDFTLPILSLLTFEGLIKDIYPELDFQQEAVPFVIQSLAIKSP
jgi:ubiquinone biosynthesis protein